MKTILNRFIECGLVSLFNWDNFFWLFEKSFFLFLDLKIKKFWKWLKVVFDGWFEVVNLVGIEYLKVKIGYCSFLYFWILTIYGTN